MKRLAATADGIEFEEVPFPVTGRGELGVRTICSMVSPGTELRYAAAVAAGAEAVALGYCAAGEVETVGEGVEGYNVGERVVALGWGWALHAPHVVVPQRLCAKVPDGMPIERAVFAALGATAQHTLARAQIYQGESVLVLGVGLVGQLVCISAATEGARLFAADPSNFRLELASRTSGATLLPGPHTKWSDEFRERSGGADVVIVTAHGANDQMLFHAVEALRRQPNGRPIGRIAVVGRVGNI